MRPDEVKGLLEGMRAGTTTAEDAFKALRRLPVDEVGATKLDTHRELRQGIPEVIYAEGKRAAEVRDIAARMLKSTSSAVLATRVSTDIADELMAAFPHAAHHERARLVVVRSDAGRYMGLGRVVVVSGGTSDAAIAEEALYTAEALGAEVESITDVGVAGVHRALAAQDRLHEAAVVIVVAGMEGALASLVGGITGAPVVAVPTSVGYGASFEGLAALLAMLNSCAAGVTVTNIDNGFGAAAFAIRVLRSRL